MFKVLSFVLSFCVFFFLVSPSIVILCVCSQPVWIACNEAECTKALIGLIIFISFQRPLSLGADICMYSATKYMNGEFLS